MVGSGKASRENKIAWMAIDNAFMLSIWRLFYQRLDCLLFFCVLFAKLLRGFLNDYLKA